MAVKITAIPWGCSIFGEAVTLRRVESDALSFEVLDYGATLRSLRVKDAHGAWVDVVLGYDSLAEYEQNDGYLGAVVGRVCNRIAGAEFELDGNRYPLYQNDGVNHLHGGKRGFDKYVWAVEELPDGLRLTRTSPDGEEGYPGTMRASVTYRVDGVSLRLDYEAESDRDTLCNLTNHSYFNLDGEGTVQEQLLKIHADRYTPNDAGCLPTGELAPVAGTAMDFRAFKPIGKDADSDEPCVNPFRGYDVNFCLDGSVPAIEAKSLKSGIVMCVTTDQPGVQCYTGQGLDHTGKGGVHYGPYAGVCLETQHYPDAIHQPHFESYVLRPQDKYDTFTIFRFTAE